MNDPHTYAYIKNPETMMQLAETIAWCNTHIRPTDPENSTRSLALRPPAMALPAHQRLRRLLQTGEAKKAVDFVCAARRQALSRLGIPVPPMSSDLAGGRILFSTIDTDSCGAATGPSCGYYDDDDLPGWDTWFFHQVIDHPLGAIYCWVPDHLVEFATLGMDVIPVQSVQWVRHGLGI